MFTILLSLLLAPQSALANENVVVISCNTLGGVGSISESQPGHYVVTPQGGMTLIANRTPVKLELERSDSKCKITATTIEKGITTKKVFTFNIVKGGYKRLISGDQTCALAERFRDSLGQCVMPAPPPSTGEPSPSVGGA